MSKTKDKRTKEIKIRLTEEEHQALLERMEGNQLATWIRQVSLAQRVAKPYKKQTPNCYAV